MEAVADSDAVSLASKLITEERVYGGCAAAVAAVWAISYACTKAAPLPKPKKATTVEDREAFDGFRRLYHAERKSHQQ